MNCKRDHLKTTQGKISTIKIIRFAFGTISVTATKPSFCISPSVGGAALTMLQVPDPEELRSLIRLRSFSKTTKSPSTVAAASVKARQTTSPFGSSISSVNRTAPKADANFTERSTLRSDPAQASVRSKPADSKPRSLPDVLSGDGAAFGFCSLPAISSVLCERFCRRY